MSDAEPYRTKEEVGMMKNEDPIELVKSRILQITGLLKAN